MSSSFYTGLQATAARLLTDKGQPIVLAKILKGTYDPVLGVTEQPEALTTVYGTVTDTPIHQMNNSFVQTGDRSIMLQGDSVNPLDFDAAYIGGERCTIFDVNDYAPGGVTLYYTFTARRGG